MPDLDLSRVKRYIRSCVLAKPGQLTSEELTNDFKERSGRALPFSQFDANFQQIMRECECVLQNGRWILESVDNKNAANLVANLSKMAPPKGRKNNRGGRVNVGGRVGYRTQSDRTSYSRKHPFTSATSFQHQSNIGAMHLDTNSQYRNDFANERSNWQEKSTDIYYGGHRLDNRMNEMRDGNDSRYVNDRSYQDSHYNTKQELNDRGRSATEYSPRVHGNEMSRQHIYDNFNPDSDESDDDDFAPPGLVPGSGFRYDSRSDAAQSNQYGSPSQHSRSSTSTPTQQPNGASFYFPPQKNARANSTVPLEKLTSDVIPYDQLCPTAIELFVSSWPTAMSAEELMNNLAKTTNLQPLVGPNLMEHHDKLISIIHKNEGSIFIEKIDGEKVYSYIPGTPEVSHEDELYEQVGKMLCLILHTNGDMTIESAQSRLGFPDNSQFTKLNGCALIMEVSKQNENIIVGLSTSGHGKDRKLSLKYGASVKNLRSQIRISRRSTIFSTTKDVSVVQEDSGRSREKRIEDLLAECEHYTSNNFKIYKAHPIADIGPEDDIEWYKGTLVFYSSLDKFAVRIDNDMANYESVQAFLQVDYEGIEWDEIFLKYIKEGAAVGVKKENGKFARGIVTHYERNVTEPSFVYLVDEGCLEEIPISSIFPLKDTMKELFPLGLRCTINAFKVHPDKFEKYYEEHQEIWNTINKESFIEISPKGVVACGGKKELVVHLRFRSEDEDYHYPKDLVENNIITLL